jgi:hypothetical protein
MKPSDLEVVFAELTPEEMDLDLSFSDMLSWEGTPIRGVYVLNSGHGPYLCVTHETIHPSNRHKIARTVMECTD